MSLIQVSALSPENPGGAGCRDRGLKLKRCRTNVEPAERNSGFRLLEIASTEETEESCESCDSAAPRCPHLIQRDLELRGLTLLECRVRSQRKLQSSLGVACACKDP